MHDASDEAPPWFSVVVSAYNRPPHIKRFLETCLAQSFRDFEVVVVDDGSRDDTADVAGATGDPRVRVIRHPRNLGLSAARDTGARAARGRWILQIDSDHGLRPGALENLYARTRDAPPDVGVIGSRYLWDTGKITPEFVPDGVIDYAGRMRWVEREGGTDYLCCYRRELYGRAAWHPDRRGPLDALFQLDLARVTRARIDPDVIALEFTDADNRISQGGGARAAKMLMGYADDTAWHFDEILRVHGEALRAHAPRTWALTHRTAAMFHFLAGDRAGGARLGARYLASAPWSPMGWAIVALGVVDRRLLAWARSRRM